MSRSEVHITNSVEETEALGQRLSRDFGPGEMVGLVGELGSGKTSFVRGVARGFGVKGYVKSPSFTIINIYAGGRLPLYHIDLYRIERAEDFHGAGLEEYVYGAGVSIIEWADNVPSILDGCAVVVRFLSRGGDEREVTVEWKEGGS